MLRQQIQTFILTALMVALFGLFLSYAPTIQTGETVSVIVEWVPQLDLQFSLYLDGLSLLFALIITGVGAVVALYTGYYFDDFKTASRFYALLAAFTGAMLLLVLAGNVLTLFIAWELTSIISFLLIGFKGDKYEDARVGAMRALIVTGGGGLALLVGLVLLGTAAGSMEFTTLLNNHDLPKHEWYTAFTILILLGCFTKSAQVPFHFWLPGGMTAPSPASAFLHSATMVKAGIYLLARLYPTLGHSPLWESALLVIGLTTMLVGALFAVRQRDLKGLLAYSTISQLGVLVALLGLPEGHGLKAAFVGILGHALYKAALFLLAGVIEHSTGTRNLDKLGGLRDSLRSTAIIAAVAAASMAGFPPLLGFVAKEALIDVMLEESGALGVIPLIVVVVSSILNGVAALLFVWDVFVAPEKEHHHVHKPSTGLITGPGLLAAMSIFTALTLSQTVIPIITPAVGKTFSLYLIPPINLAFGLSILVLVMTPIVFSMRGWWLKLPDFPLPRGATVFAGLIGVVERVGDTTLRLQSGKLRYYLVLILMSVFFFIVWGNTAVGQVLNIPPLNIRLANPATDFLKILLLGLSIAACIASIIFRRHLLAALSLGVMGYAVGGIFLLEPAPDVALVQILVETLGTVLIIMMLGRIASTYRLKLIENLWERSSRTGVIRDIIVSIAIGTAVALFSLSAVTNRPERNEFNIPLAYWYLENAYEELGVADAVGGIVTDFRGTDTVIEITVFSTAALAVLTLLTLPEARELLMGRPVQKMRDYMASVNYDNDEQLRELEQGRAESELSTPLTRLVAGLVLPFSLIIAFTHLFYGGTAPGDGFTAGVIGGLGVAMLYVVFGYFETRRRLHWLKPGRLITFGLTVTLVNAFLPVFFGDAFLQIQQIKEFHPADLHLATTLAFEFGIFLTVFGGSSVIMEAISHPREVEKV